jgi:hypothetical protein
MANFTKFEYDTNKSRSTMGTSSVKPDEACAV